MNKILVLVYIPEIEQEYDVYIPINKKIGTIKKYLISSVEEFNDGNVSTIENFKIYDKDNSKIYDNNTYVRDSGIKNGTKLILM